MDLQTELRYDAEVDRVYAMLCDKDFRSQVCEATLARSYDIAVTPGDAATGVRISRVMVTPDNAKRLLGDTLEIVQVEEWAAPTADGSRSAALSVDITGRPGSMRGRIQLTPAGGGTVQTITGDVRVKVPLVGAKLEKEISKALRAAIKEEGRVGTRWLAG